MTTNFEGIRKYLETIEDAAKEKDQPILKVNFIFNVSANNYTIKEEYSLAGNFC